MPTAVVPVMPISESKSRPTLLLMNGLAERSGISTWSLMTPPASLPGGWFDTQETLHAYYHVLKQILTTYGIPAKIFTDNRTVFNYKRKNSPSLDEDTQTQFGYACKQLGIRMNTSSVPQAKGV